MNDIIDLPTHLNDLDMIHTDVVWTFWVKYTSHIGGFGPPNPTTSDTEKGVWDHYWENTNRMSYAWDRQHMLKYLLRFVRYTRLNEPTAYERLYPVMFQAICRFNIYDPEGDVRQAHIDYSTVRDWLRKHPHAV